MTLDEALPLLKATVGVPFKELFEDVPIDLRTNKGNVGQLLLLHIGLVLDSKLKDFSDGELKTNKSDMFGDPKETMFITQISRNIDSYVGKNPLPFDKTQLFEKIDNLVFLPVCKDARDRRDWFFTSCHHVNLPTQPSIYQQLNEDYNNIVEKLSHDIETSEDGFIHTSSGKFIQVRSKDSKPYHPIFSEKYGKYISNKNHAFYFKKEFMRHCRLLNL